MALEKGIAELVEKFIAAGRPSSRQQSIAQRREGYIASAVLAGETETRVDIQTIELEGMTLRIVSPLNAPTLLPTIIYYYGGCFVSGGFATHDNQLRQLAYYGQCRVIAVQYRLAPEHTFPAAHDDAQRGAEIVWQHAERLGVDKQRITLAGDSAGGHLALVTALRLKRAGEWQPAQLILIYPMLDATAHFESYIRNGHDYIITRDTLLSGFEMYLPGIERRHPEASPLWRDDFNGLPPVHIITAEYDPLCDEGEALYHRMTGQGVQCTCQRYLGVIHGFFQLGGISEAARSALRDVAWRAAFLIIMILLIRRVMSGYGFGGKGNALSTLMTAITAGICGFLVQGMFDNCFYNYRVMLVFWCVAAMARVCVYLAESDAKGTCDGGATGGAEV